MIRWLSFFLAMLLGGCAMFRPAPVALPAQPEAVPFAMNGRISIDHRGERHSAGMRWIHLESSDEILLFNPLGQAVGRVFREAGKATLDSDGKHYQARNVEELMEEVLGWHLPLDGLHHWVLGLPVAQDKSHIERDQDGRITMLTQDGWEVRYVSYEDTLPSRMHLSHEDMQVKLLIDEWDWNPQ